MLKPFLNKTSDCCVENGNLLVIGLS